MVFVATAQATGFLQRAQGRRLDAEKALEEWRIDVSLSNAIESIEFAAKSAFKLLGVEYKRDHRFDAASLTEFVNSLPAQAKTASINWPRLLVLCDFWIGFYTTAKYGSDTLSVPASDLFEREQAELALRHAGEWLVAASVLNSFV
jgi:hypothetical protein